MQKDKELTKHLTERLIYLLTDCPPTEYDPIEVNSCINLLAKLSETEQRHTKIITIPQTKAKRIAIQPYTPSTGKKIAYLSIALAASIATIAFLSVKAPALAEPIKGFFHWIKFDETGFQMVTSPSALPDETPFPKECNCCPNCSCGCQTQKK